MDTQIKIVHAPASGVEANVNAFLKTIGKAAVIKVCDLVADPGNPGYFTCMVIYHKDKDGDS